MNRVVVAIDGTVIDGVEKRRRFAAVSAGVGGEGS